MHPIRKQRLGIVLLIVLGSALAIGLLTFALRDHLHLFYAPAQIAAGEAPVGQSIRAGGMVLADSVQRDTHSLRVTFTISDYQSHLPVVYTGILPDLFAEQQGVVVMGVLDGNGVFQAQEVLAKHDENYMPREVKEALQQSHNQESYGPKNYNQETP